MTKFNQTSIIHLISHYQRNKQPPGRARGARTASSAAAAHGVNCHFRVKGPNRTTNIPQLFKYHHYFWLLTFWSFFFFFFSSLTTTHIFLVLMASKFQDLFCWFAPCSKYSQPLQLCAGRGGAAASAQNCVLCWLPVPTPSRKGAFQSSHCISRLELNHQIHGVVTSVLQKRGRRTWLKAPKVFHAISVF